MSAVHLGSVSKAFSGRAGSVQALADIDLTVEPGEFVTLLGPSGCGKTTMLRLISGLVTPDSGTVSVMDASPQEARSTGHIALVPQTPALLPWLTVRGNAELLTKVNRKQAARTNPERPAVSELLKTVGLTKVASAYPQELSGGMQQRVALVRAFALGAPILLMDEPFVGLDEILRVQMRYLLLRLWQARQATVVFVTHSVTEAVTLSDRVVVLSAHPGVIQGVENIELPWPRREDVEESPEFTAHVRRVRHLLRQATELTGAAA